VADPLHQSVQDNLDPPGVAPLLGLLLQDEIPQMEMEQLDLLQQIQHLPDLMVMVHPHEDLLLQEEEEHLLREVRMT